MEGKAKEFPVGAFTSARSALVLASLVGMIAAMTLTGSHRMVGAPAIAMVALAIVLSVISRMASRMVVGSDGILLRSLFKRQFIPYRSIEHVALRNTYGTRHPSQVTGIELLIERNDGKPIRIPPRGESRALFEAVVEARRAHRARTVGAFDAHALRPDGADGKAWLQRLRALADQVQGFRVDAPSRDELLAIVEDVHADEEARAAASVVVAAGKDEKATARLRVALEATASPRLRVAIDAALAGEDDSVAEALDSVRTRA